MPINALERSIYEHALQHLEKRRDELHSLIAHVRSQTGTAKAVFVDPTMPEWVMTAAERAASTKPVKKARKKRVMSPEAREKVAAAQRKRWAAFHKSQAAAAKPAEPVTKKAVTKKAAKATKKA